MLSLIFDAVWLSILIALFTRGYKVSWTALLGWIFLITLVGWFAGYMMTQLAGNVVGGVAQLVVNWGGIYYLVHDRYGIDEPRKIALLLFLFALPGLLFLGTLLVIGQPGTP